MERPKVGVGVIIRKEGEVLLLRRQGSHGAGTWSFPGGHLEFGETVEACAVRETMEEVGITIKNLRHGPWTNDNTFMEGKHYVTIYILAEIASGEPRLMEPDKATELGWFSWDALPKPLFLPVENLLKRGYSPLRDEPVLERKGA